MVTVTERKYLMDTLLKTDAGPWSLLVLSAVTVLGISFRLPGRGSAQPPTKFAGCQMPWSSLSRHRKCQPSCMALSNATQLCCQQLYLCSLPRDELVSGWLFHGLVRNMFAFAWSRVWEAASLDSLYSLPVSQTVFATPLVWTTYFRFRLSCVRLEG